MTEWSTEELIEADPPSLKKATAWFVC